MGFMLQKSWHLPCMSMHGCHHLLVFHCSHREFQGVLERCNVVFELAVCCAHVKPAAMVLAIATNCHSASAMHAQLHVTDI